MFLFQGITYLMHNEWTVYSMYYLVEMGPESLRAQVDASPGLANAVNGCPLFLALLVVGLVLLFIGSRLSSRYIN
jgi:hypothetical protein